jgi:hypothetical protein
MNSEQSFRSMLQSVDMPVQPDAEFARRLRRDVVAVAGSGRRDEGPDPEVFRVRRNRLLDLVAVAMLLLSMIAGLIGIRAGTIGTATPTVQAESAPAMVDASPIATSPSDDP